ncbi:MAG: formate dehydrogenase accessory sulfurtransferase FdhD, partial [Myxococcota bacterium]
MAAARLQDRSFEDEAVEEVTRLQWSSDGWTRSNDLLVKEEPIEIRIDGAPIAVLMRTPGHDEELVRGFLLTERIAAERGQ